MLILEGLLKFVDLALGAYMILLVLTGVLRMAGADESKPFVRGISALVDPPANWLRRRFPRLVVRTQDQYVDFSPFVLLLAVGFVQIMLPRIVLFLIHTFGV